MRKKANEKSVLENIAHGFYFLTIQVNDVRKRLESEERDPNGKNKFIYAEGRVEIAVTELRKVIEENEIGAQHLVRTFGKKISVLKISQQKKIDAHTESDEHFFRPVFFCAINKLSPSVIAANGKDEQDKKNTARFVIKEKAYGQEINGSRFAEFVKERVEHKHNRQEEPKEKLGEEQRLILLIRKNGLKDILKKIVHVLMRTN